ncbi:MAG: endolytic transglycosylase MltG [Candidatus Margulisbacteria bacterium]|jgi:UPF0755 protein|nr:endolytic transglycosylase MltG [Candidatus Margulisiibacteriota bacterium]
MKDKPVWLLVILFIIMIWPANPFDLSVRRVIIPAGSSVRAIERTLRQQGILPRYTAFRLFVRFCKLSARLKAGEYDFSPSDPLPRLITRLVINETVPLPVQAITLPEGTSIYKMGLLLQKGGFKSWRPFQGLVQEGITAKLREKYWHIFKFVPSESLEGYLFPDTYQFYLNTPAETMALVMVDRFDQVVLPFWRRAKQDTKMTLHEVLTLASIIEKEAQKPAERPLISSVFHNRLAKGMPLAADPTVKYALERPSKRVFYDQLSVNSPYNTYKRKGLPPGPICNPGLDSIKAAVYPAKTNYYFFVANKDGSHTFSIDWAGHQKARSRIK